MGIVVKLRTRGKNPTEKFVEVEFEIAARLLEVTDDLHTIEDLKHAFHNAQDGKVLVKSSTAIRIAMLPR